MSEGIALTLFVVMILLVLVLGLCAQYTLENKACNTKAQSFEAHEYYFIGGCMVKHNGKWLPLENIRGFDDK